MKEQNLNDYGDKISLNIREKLGKIYAIEYHYDLNEVISSIKELPTFQRKKILEKLINDLLLKIKTNNSYQDIKDVNNSADKALDFFVYETKDYEISEEADSVVDDLICKILGQKNRHIELPIKVQFIEDFCIHSMIEQKDIERTLILIVVKLSIVDYCLEHKKYNQQFS